MRRRRRAKRPILFVCSAILNKTLISEVLEAPEKKVAQRIFEEKFQIAPTFIFGPFFKKRIFIEPIPCTDLVLSGEVKKAEFNGWLVRANILKNPPNCAFLLFESRIDGKKMSKPQNKVVSLQDLEIKKYE
jgi:hypothetical protein